jgi:glycerol-3-phosphate dehydrogenase
MAADAVDAAVQGLDRTVGPSVTADVPLVGAVGWPALWNQRHLLARRSGLHQERVEHLLRRYGVLTEQVLALVAADPSLAEPLPEADDYLRAEVVYSAGHEGARHVDDVLTRRTRISIESWDRGVAAAEVVAELMGDVLGWSAARREAEVERYHERVAAERASQQLPDDASADAARLGAREVALPG